MTDPAPSAAKRAALIVAPVLFKWTVWCLAVPLWIVGPSGLRDLFRAAPSRVGRPAWLGWSLLALPLLLA